MCCSSIIISMCNLLVMWVILVLILIVMWMMNC